jgi:formylglycine-generating enzyme required for sulfatase activity
MVFESAEIRKLCVILALVCSIAACTRVAAQTKAVGRAPGADFRDCGACPEMVVISAGSFAMGSSAEERPWAATHGGSPGSVADEAPQHQVSLQSFALGKYDVTRGEYATFVRETGHPRVMVAARTAPTPTATHGTRPPASAGRIRAFSKLTAIRSCV